MANPYNKRSTRINFSELRRSKPPALPTVELGYETQTTSTVGESQTIAKGLRQTRQYTVLTTRASNFVKFGSPWDQYEKVYDLRLGNRDGITVGQVKDPPSYDVSAARDRTTTPYVVTVRILPTNNAEQKVHMLQRIEHANIVSIREVFSYERHFYAVFDHMPLSLSEFSGVSMIITEIQLASVMGQILDGLLYLATEGLEHTSLNSSTILMNQAGEVKIAYQECCRTRQPSDSATRDVKALHSIAAELLSKNFDDKELALQDERLQKSFGSKTASFLSRSLSAVTVEELKESAMGYTTPSRDNRLCFDRHIQGLQVSAQLVNLDSLGTLCRIIGRQ